MGINRVIPLFFVALFTCLPMCLPAQSSGSVEEGKVYLVLMDLKADIDLTFLYSKKYDKKFVQLTYALDDSINNLDDFSYHEDPLLGPECFVPEIKLVYEYHTYVISLFCAKVVKYRNQTPWFTSQQRLVNDLDLTPSLLLFLDRLRVQHFGPEATNEEYFKGVPTGSPVEVLQDNGAELEWLFNEDLMEDEEADLEFEEERILPDEEEPEIEEDDDGR